MLHLTPRLSCLALIGSLAIIAVSRSDDDRPKCVPDDRIVRGLTENAARGAIIALVERMSQEEQDYYQLRNLRAGNALAILDEQKEKFVTTRTWNCHLKDKTFVFPGPFRPHGCTREENGVFEQESGRWQARVTGRSWACSK